MLDTHFADRKASFLEGRMDLGEAELLMKTQVSNFEDDIIESGSWKYLVQRSRAATPKFVGALPDVFAIAPKCDGNPARSENQLGVIPVMLMGMVEEPISRPGKELKLDETG